MILVPNELARRDGGTVAYRTEPLRTRVELADLITADQHELRVSFECSVQPAEHPADRKMLHEMFLARGEVATFDDVTRYFEPALRTAAETVAGQHNAADLLSDTGRATLLAALRKSADAAAFSAGLLVFPPFAITVASPTVARQQIEAMERARAAADASGRIEHLRQAAELLKQFEAVRAESPNLPAGRILETIAPADRGAMLESLLAASGASGQGKTLYAVAGPFLVSIDTRQRPLKPELVQLPSTLGPFRSVQPADVNGRKVLLLGARNGFLLMEPGNIESVQTYAAPAIVSQQGFNRVVFWKNPTGFWATHGEGGLLAWGVGNTVGPHTTIPKHAAGGPRNVHVVDAGWLVYSEGSQLILFDGEDGGLLPKESDAPIIAIIPETSRLFVVHADGLVCTLDRSSRTIITRDRTGGTVVAAGALPWLDGIRLLLARESGPIDCVGTDDSLVTRYTSSYQSLRAVTACAEMVAAVSSDRQRIVLWNSHVTRAPAVDLHITSLTRHRVADIAFA